MHIDIQRTEKRIAVIGGGASGCMAAIAAASAGCRVFLFEKNEKLAKKLYATGNGRCNLTNLYQDPSCYHTGPAGRFSSAEKGDPSGRIFDWIREFSPEDLILFFREAGVPVHDRDGWVYPRTDQAQTIVRALEKCIRERKIEVFLNSSVESIEDLRAARSPKPDSLSEDARFRIRCFLKENAPAVRGKESGKTYRNQKGEKKGKTGKKQTTGQAGYEKRENRPAAGRTEQGERPGGLKEFFCDAVILCTGGLAGPSFGCTGDGYRLAERFSHQIRQPLPALTQIVCASPCLKYAAGVRCQAKISLYVPGSGSSRDTRHGALPGDAEAHREHTAVDFAGQEGSHGALPGEAEAHREHTAAGFNEQEGSLDRAAEVCAAEESGELQITDYGLSGIPVFQLSRTAARLLDAGKTVYARIDFLPWMTDEMFARETSHKLRTETRDQMLSDFFLGLAHKKVLDLVLASRGWQSEMKAKRLTDTELLKLMELLRCFELQVTGVGSFENAQVTCGGISLGEVDDHFGSVFCPGLYFAGEVLDVDGRCGGYNLQWAMTSGTLAGRAAAGSL